jgi:hypothetical protein
LGFFGKYSTQKIPPRRVKMDFEEKRILFIILIITAILIIFPIFGNSNGDKVEDRTTDAKICARDIVENNLKSPSTAKHPNFSEMTVRHIEGNNYKVYSYVEAQNGFGAMVKTNYVVTLELTESGYKNGSVTFSE